MKLSHYLLISFTALILAIVLMTTVGSGLLIKGSFDTYLLENQLDKVEGLKVLLEKRIIQSDDIKGSFIELEEYLSRNRLLLRLYTPAGVLLYENTLQLSPGQGQGQGMMRRMITNMNEEQIEIKENGKLVALAEVGYLGDFSESKQAINFKNSLQVTLGITAFLTLLIGIGLSYALSKKINTPVIDVSRVAKSISQGNLKARSTAKTPIAELKALSQSVDHMAEELDTQEILRRNLMLSMGHEIKTPLTIVKAQIEGYIDKVIEPSPENLKSSFEELERLQSIVENLEMLSAIQEDNALLSIEQIAAKEEFEKSESAFKQRLIDAKLRLFYTGEEPNLRTDRIKLRQIIDNIMVNAIKYAYKDSEIHVQLKTVKEGVRLTVSNEADTLSPEDQKRLFDIHFRTEGARSKEGRGIGLYVTKALVQQLKGTIHIESIDHRFNVDIFLRDIKTR